MNDRMRGKKENSVRGGSRNARAGRAISRRDIFFDVCVSFETQVRVCRILKSLFRRESRRENADPASLRWKLMITERKASACK